MELGSYFSQGWGFKTLVSSFFGLDDFDSTKRISASKAVSSAPVWYAVNRIAGNVAQMPLFLMKRLDRGSEKATKHPCYRLVKHRPNGFQTPAVWKHQMMVHALLWGNSRNYIHRVAGVPNELIPLMPDRTLTGMMDGQKYHATLIDRDDRMSLVEDMMGKPTKVKLIHDNDVLHFPWMSFDGVEGEDFLKIAANSIKAGLAMGDRARTAAQKGFSGGLMLQAPDGKLRQEEDAKRYLEFFREHHDGEENAGKTGLLRDGITAQLIASSANDAQLIQNRLFERQETALWFGLESILGDDKSVSYNSLEQKMQAFLTNTLSPFLVKIEEEMNIKLLSEREKLRETHFFKFNVAALMRMDSATQAEYFTKMVASKIMSPNEVREKLDMNPYDGGDEYENPAITPGSTDTPDSSSDDTSQRSFAAVSSRLKHMVGVEVNRVVACTKQKNFNAALDKFYAKWNNTLAEVIEELGGDADMAYEYCAESHEALNELSGNVSQDGLEAAVNALVSKWEIRANELAKRICNED